METNQLWAIVISSGVSVVACLIFVIRTLMDKPKAVNGNGNGGAKQSRECWEQHQVVLSKLDMIQKTLDDRQAVFAKVQERLDDINITVLRGWDGADRRKS